MMKDSEYAKLAQAEEGLASNDYQHDSLELVEATAVPVEKGTTGSAVIAKVTVSRPTKETPFGVRYSANQNGYIEIVHVTPGGLVDKTAPGVIQEGMKLLSVNGIDFQASSESPESFVQALVALLQTLEGNVTIIATNDKQAGYVSVTRPISSFSDEQIEKEGDKTTENPWHGLTFTSATGREVAVKSIDMKMSPFAFHMTSSGVMLQNLDSLIMINDFDCTNGSASSEDAERMLNDVPEGDTVAIYFTTFFQRGFRPSSARGKVAHGQPSPPGVPSGGVWGSVVHLGGHTQCSSIICCLLCGLLPAAVILCFPFDRRRAYKVNNRVYSSDGILIPGRDTFVAGQMQSYVDEDRKTHAFIYATVVGSVGLFLYLALMASQ